MADVTYVGRFAPSPTGPLHAGSIATAVASFLHARQQRGKWLLRIDDLDPPRCVPGSADAIVDLLTRLQLHWDESVYLQSRRRNEHAAVAEALLEKHLAFRCDCSRRDLRGDHKTGLLGIRYVGRCRNRYVPAGDSAIRMRVAEGTVKFDDRLQGTQLMDLSAELGDYVIYRRDDLPAYHLAAVLDDADQGVTDVVRGCDLLPSTSVHVHLGQTLGLPIPRYWHVPVVCGLDGQKLSKSHRAASVAERSTSEIAFAALQHIGAEPPAELAGAPPQLLWDWAIAHWRIETLRGVTTRPVVSA